MVCMCFIKINDVVIDLKVFCHLSGWFFPLGTKRAMSAFQSFQVSIPSYVNDPNYIDRINHVVEDKRSDINTQTNYQSEGNQEEENEAAENEVEENHNLFPLSKHHDMPHEEDMTIDNSVKIDQLLSDLYYKPSSPVSFSAPEKLFDAAKRKNRFVTLSDVRHWLSRQSTYTSFRINHQKFKRRKVIVRGLRHQYQADLMDMSALKSQNNGVRFLLTVIDCFSRLAAVVPLKSKHAINVLNGIKIAFERLGVPDKLQTDQGKEFWNYQLKTYLQSLGVILFYTDQELKAQMVERFNRTIREKIKKYMKANQTLKYVDVLPRLVQSYNTSPHRGLHGYAPVQVNKDNEKKIFDLQYGKYLAETRSHHKFKVGDHVKAVAAKIQFMKDRPTFEDETFVVVDCIHSNPPTYKLKRLGTQHLVPGTYYESQLQKIWEK